MEAIRNTVEKNYSWQQCEIHLSVRWVRTTLCKEGICIFGSKLYQCPSLIFSKP